MSSVLVDDLVVRRRDIVAVDGASWSAAAGEVTVVLGPNGAGKTTTVETAVGLFRPAAGRVRVLGEDPASVPDDWRSKVGVMLQDGQLPPGLRVGEALTRDARLHVDARSIAETARRAGVADVLDKPFGRLSGGQKQRTMLALALIGGPEVLFLDEPTSGVDAEGRAAIRDVVAAEAAAGAAVVVTTHELAEAERMADRFVVMSAGRVVAAGRRDEIGGDRSVRFGAPPDFDPTDLAADIGRSIAAEGAGRFRVDGDGDPDLVAAVAAAAARRGVTLTDISVGEDLESLFRRLTEGDR